MDSICIWDNVTILARRYGLKTAYMGPMGNDPAGELLHDRSKYNKMANAVNPFSENNKFEKGGDLI